MRLSDKGLAFIAGFEGFVARPYNDAASPPNATVGFGHLLHYGPVTVRDRARYPFGISRTAALKLLRADVAKAEHAVNRNVTRPLGQGQFDALVSFTFNCGAGALEHSTLLREVNEHLGAKGAHRIRADFMRWTHAGGIKLDGLVLRRQAEAHLYLNGVYG